MLISDPFDHVTFSLWDLLRYLSDHSSHHVITLRNLWSFIMLDPSTCQFLSSFFLPETLRIPLARIGLYILGFVCVFFVILFFTTNCTMGFITIVHLGVNIFLSFLEASWPLCTSKCIIWILWGEALPTNSNDPGRPKKQAPRSVSPSYAAQHAKRQGGRCFFHPKRVPGSL